MPMLSLLESAVFDPESTKTLAWAFESAWNVLRRPGGTLADNDMAMVTREELAKRIIEWRRQVRQIDTAW